MFVFVCVCILSYDLLYRLRLHNCSEIDSGRGEEGEWKKQEEKGEWRVSIISESTSS